MKGETNEDKRYLHNVGVFKIVGREDLEFQLEWHLSFVVIRIFILVLVVDQVCDYVGLTYVDQETVSDDDGALELGEGTVTFAQVADFVNFGKCVKHYVKLTTLVTVTTAHHWVDRRLLLLFTCILRIVWVVHWNNEIIHILLSYLLTSVCIFNIAPSCSCSIVFLFFLIVLGSILHSEVSIAIIFISPWAIVSTKALGCILAKILWDNSHGVDKQGEILLQMGRAQNFKLEGGNSSLVNQLLQLLLLSLGGPNSKVVGYFFVVKDIETIVILALFCSCYVFVLLLLLLHLLVVHLVLRDSLVEVLTLVVLIKILIRVLVLHPPLLLFLTFDHVLNIFAHWLS